jgi:hypothetical protein
VAFAICVAVGPTVAIFFGAAAYVVAGESPGVLLENLADADMLTSGDEAAGVLGVSEAPSILVAGG